ncbi:hypothetical protein BK004_02905 [bacterium CG10_46_32]|nr:MAG: hypothetical protein BK004_02905 [bacterium CG10_46_32]PIR56050.1 MAG: hypothetical protein COU73_02935 [Parcubacteria group bacterium CG10_big_fil_rev_8_21_14_0_10_46_32]
MGKNNKNNYAFIDSQNLNLGIKKLGWKLDYKRFRVYLQEKYGAKKAYLFIGYIPRYASLYRSLENFGYSIIFKPIIETHDGQVKGNIDAELVLQTMIEYQNYDQAIIVIGDGDFYCLVKYLAAQKKFMRLIVPNRYRYSVLLRVTKPITFMNDLKQRLEYKKTSPALTGDVVGGST